MPSQSFTAALLALSSAGLPWGVPSWQAITRIPGEPWSTVDNAPEDSPSLYVPEWTNRVAAQVKAYVTTVLGMPVGAQDRYMAKRVLDKDSAARTAWAAFISKRSSQWGINKIIDEVLETAGRAPNQMLRDLGTNSLPHAEPAQIYDCVTPLAQKLFGDDAYVGRGSFLKEAVIKFCRTILTLSWNRYRKGVARDVHLMDTLYDVVTETWKAFSAEGTTHTTSAIRSFIKDLRKLLKLYVRYDDQERRARVERYMADMVEMLRVVCKEPGSKDSDKLPKNLRDILLGLASEHDVQAITQALLVSIEDLDSAESVEPVELDLDAPIEPDWKEGVEALSKFSDEQLWQKLGIPDQRLPFFQQWTDPDGMIDPWSDEGQAWLQNMTEKRESLQPRWHQLVGIYRMLERVFEGKPILLMDGVGLGKTLQVLGVIACLAYYRYVYAKKKAFPGDFAGLKFNTPDGNVPDFSHVIVCPVNLKQQWESEIRRFLVPASFDLFPYTGRLDSRSAWWTELFTVSKQPLCQRIILATQTAIQDDAVTVFTPQTIKERTGHAIPGTRFETNAPRTLYGRRYCLVIMDEAHSARKHNQIHRAFRGLKERATSVIAMTATPITTKAQDLYIMGQWMGIPGFDNHNEFLELNKEINRANRQDSKALREAGIEGSIICGIFIGIRNQNTPDLLSPEVTREWMVKIRDRFAHNVIRRTINSVDHAGNKLFGLKPYLEHILKLRMYDNEMGVLRSFAKDLVRENPIASADTRKNFYIEFRRSMLHPMLNPKNGGHWKKPLSLSHWQEEKTIKLDTLAHVVRHHLDSNGRVPLTMTEDGQTLTLAPDGLQDMSDYGEDDRVVIYSAFPSSNQALIDILDLYGIAATELNGTMSLKKRQAALDDFRTSTRTKGHRVLIISNVGMVGLNLACANVMVIVDATWSALDDEQLRGRIFRYPQQKQVHIYRLIALGTPDVFLNNISFDKGQLHSAFVGCTDDIRGLFEDDSLGDDSLLSISSTQSDGGDDSLDGDDNGARTKQSRSKPVPKQRQTPVGWGKGKHRQAELSENEGEENAASSMDIDPPGSKPCSKKQPHRREKRGPGSSPEVRLGLG
ncbi:P-loop containing nucleoside triphosphate hydrolase protein [Pisolithus tinctorius]|nr:P-loop containing nucleoside triphosphate hydrolase protein [Pisolithus tinctorius]